MKSVIVGMLAMSVTSYTRNIGIEATYVKFIIVKCYLSSVDRYSTNRPAAGMDIRRQVGRNLKRIRRERGWSQEQLAFESGLHRTYISGIERGARNPTVLILARIAETLDVKVSDLVKG